MSRFNPYITVRELATQVVLLRKLTYAPGSTQHSVVTEVENALIGNAKNVAILRKLNNLRTWVRNKLRAVYRALQRIQPQDRNVTGDVPPFGALTLEQFKASARATQPILPQPDCDQLH